MNQWFKGQMFWNHQWSLLDILKWLYWDKHEPLFTRLLAPWRIATEIQFTEGEQGLVAELCTQNNFCEEVNEIANI